MRALLPTLKEKKRYVAFEVVSEAKFSATSMYHALHQALAKYLGIQGLSNAGIIILTERWNEARQRGIVRVNHTAVDHVKAALTLMTGIEGHGAMVRSLISSGTLKKVGPHLS